MLLLLYLLTPFFDFLKKKSNLYKKERDSYNVNEFIDHSNEHLKISSFDTKDILQSSRDGKIKQLAEKIKPLHFQSLHYMNNIKNIARDLEIAKIDVQERSFESLLINSKRIKGINKSLVNTLVHIGIGAAGVVVDVIPELQTFAGLNFDFVEADLPEVEVNADLMAWAVAGAAALTPITIQVEVEEIG